MSVYDDERPPRAPLFALHQPASETEDMIRRLVLAARDMEQAGTAAQVRLSRKAPSLDRLLDTAMAVCYARPFKKHGIGLLGPEWKPNDPEQRALHDRLVTLRDKYYAHTDVTPYRGVVNIGAALGDTRPMFAESWLPEAVSENDLAKVVDLCKSQRHRFTDEARKLEDELPPNPS